MCLVFLAIYILRMYYLCYSFTNIPNISTGDKTHVMSTYYLPNFFTTTADK